MIPACVVSEAQFSPCGAYRYTLMRRWANGGIVNWIALNPSTADQTKNDPTVTRMISFAQRWGYDGLIVTNLFAYRSTDPGNLRQVDDPIGQDNNEYIQKIAKTAELVVCAWGVHGAFMDRGRQVVTMLTASEIVLHCLGTTKAGHPRHPLYLKGSSVPEVFR